MHEIGAALIGERLEIAADGLARHTEPFGKKRNADRARGVERVQNMILAADGERAIHEAALRLKRRADVAFCGNFCKRGR
jgi:hypothetical protein